MRVPPRFSSPGACPAVTLRSAGAGTGQRYVAPRRCVSAPRGSGVISGVVSPGMPGPVRWGDPPGGPGPVAGGAVGEEAKLWRLCVGLMASRLTEEHERNGFAPFLPSLKILERVWLGLSTCKCKLCRGGMYYA